MQHIRLGETILQIKDYECSSDGAYPTKTDTRLWLYVNLTDACNAACPFCVNSNRRPQQIIDPAVFSTVLKQISPFVSGISFTGGEPMLDIGLLEEAIAVADGLVDSGVRFDLATNGTNIKRLLHVRGLERFTTVHVSRHATDDSTNRRLMAWPDAPSANDLASVFGDLADPGCTVLNCVLQRDGVYDRATATEYLEMAASIGAANVSFIGMIAANSYCEQGYVSPASLELEKDERCSIWNRFQDHGFCNCSAGDYKAARRYIRFYYRQANNANPAHYCRQLVYGADNILRQGFGNAPAVALRV